MNIEQHAASLIGHHISAADAFAKVPNVPPVPKRKQLQWRAGWTRYGSDGVICKVQWPMEQVYVFDTETFVLAGNYPVMATAISSEAVYVWLSAEMVNPTTTTPTGPDLIPLNTGSFIIAHNANFDRARVQGEYELMGRSPANFWFCTLSATVAISVCASQQKWGLQAMRKPWKALTEGERKFRSNPPMWVQHAMGGGRGKSEDRVSLVEAYNHHVANELSDDEKHIRDAFTKAKTIAELANRAELVEYGIRDVVYTMALFSKIWPKYRAATPTYVGLSANYHQHQAKIPLCKDWQGWVLGVEAMYQAQLREASEIFLTAMREAVEPWQQALRRDVERVMPTLSSMVSGTDIKVTKATTPEQLINKLHKAGVGNLLTESTHYATQQTDFWLRQLDWTPILTGQFAYTPKWASQYLSGKKEATPKLHMAGLLLRCTWGGHPVLYSYEKGYRYLDVTTGEIRPVPNPRDKGAKVSMLFAKGFIDKPMLGSSNSKAQRILAIGAQIAFWDHMRTTILGDLHRDKPKSPPFMRQMAEGYPLVIPDVKPHGTVSRRTSSAIWSVMPSTKANRIGTELRSRVEAPSGYKLVGADFDKQELQVASIFSDLENGSRTEFTDSVLHGDPHTEMATALDIARPVAKSANFAMMYGGGVEGIVKSVREEFPDKDPEEIKAVAERAIGYLKGRKDEETSRYFGGSASPYFNHISSVAMQTIPTTPALGTRISAALWNYPPVCHNGRAIAINGEGDNTYRLTKENWVVQASGSDILAIFLNAVDALAEVKYEFVLSVHDEAWFLVREADAIPFALTMQRSHRATWEHFHQAVGLPGCPPERYYFSGVSIDQRIRKSPTDSTTTLSHDGAAEPNGQEWTVDELHTWAVANGHTGLL